MDIPTSYVNLLNSQTVYDLESPDPAWLSRQSPDDSSVKERRKWTPKEDKILIGAWLNTSKDAVVSNEQKGGAFWQRICDLYNSSPQLVGTTPRELNQCKQRWARINDQVCKFVGCYDTALREQRSGHNDDDVMRNAHEMFHSDHGYRFNVDHAWRELRHDSKWCSTYVAKDSHKEKRKPVTEIDADQEVGEAESRPAGVKAAKAASKKKKSGKEEELSRVTAMLDVKEKIANKKLLDRLLAKGDSLSEMETSLKMKLMADML